MKHTHFHNQARRAVTLTELLVVLVIVSLLATIAIPVYINRSQQARIATAQREMREIAQAQSACALVHGFYVPLQLLDDLHPDVNLPSAGVVEDDLQNSTDSATVYVIDATLDPELQDGASQFILEDTATNPRVERMYNNWAGPFLNVQRYYYSEVQNPSTTQVRRDFPLDPWGQPYRFYSPIGVIGDNGAAVDPNAWDNDTAFNGALTNFDARFDRYAIVSYGPDGDTSTASNADERQDDLKYLFGGLFTESSFTAFR